MACAQQNHRTHFVAPEVGPDQHHGQQQQTLELCRFPSSSSSLVGSGGGRAGDGSANDLPAGRLQRAVLPHVHQHTAVSLQQRPGHHGDVAEPISPPSYERLPPQPGRV